ncbi:MAG: cellulase family glycosylhydrolase [Lachnospiraceae bacterium]|nr:cellulase family glycosylhydrolase [Lachnospiraceae bacterium]
MFKMEDLKRFIRKHAPKNKRKWMRVVSAVFIVCLIIAIPVSYLSTKDVERIEEDEVPLAPSIRNSFFQTLWNKYFNTGKQSDVKALHVSGTQIYDRNNNQVILKGLCTADSGLMYNNWAGADWDTWYNVDSLKTIKNWGINTIRLTFSPEQYCQNPSIIADYEKYIDLCTESGLYTIISWQVIGNPKEYASSASTFFNVLSKKYAESPYVIYEICNEPFDSTWDEIKSYSDKIIPAIRKNSPNSLVLVGLPYTSNTITDSVKSVIGDELPYSNIVYTHHIYTGQSMTQSRLDNITEVLKNNIPIMISEWSGTMSNGTDGFNTSTAKTFMRFLENNQLSWVFFNMSDIQYKLAANIPYDSSMVVHGRWSNTLEDPLLSDAGLFIKHYMLGVDDDDTTYLGAASAANNTLLEEPCQMMEYSDGYAFWNDEYKEKITSVQFETNQDGAKNCLISWDVSFLNGDGDVIAYINQNGDDYQLHIASKTGNVIAPIYLENFFNGFSKLENIDFTNLDTSSTRSMKNLFKYCKKLNAVDMSPLNTGSVVELSCMFEGCASLEKIDLSECDLSKVKAVAYMFAYASNLQNIDLGNINLSSLTSTKSFMVGTSSTIKVRADSTQDITSLTATK